MYVYNNNNNNITIYDHFSEIKLITLSVSQCICICTMYFLYYVLHSGYTRAHKCCKTLPAFRPNKKHTKTTTSLCGANALFTICKRRSIDWQTRRLLKTIPARLLRSLWFEVFPILPAIIIRNKGADCRKPDSH